MKYKVKISDRSYDVEIEDIHARPVIARVDGQVFEVHPEKDNLPQIREESIASKPVAVTRRPMLLTDVVNELTAPLPGTIIEIFIKPGDPIEAGQVVLV